MSRSEVATLKANIQIKRKPAIYARVSSKEQEKEGFSIPVQLRLLTSYANEKGLTVVQQYVDVETAKRAGRTGFTAMLDFFRGESRLRYRRIPAAYCSLKKPIDFTAILRTGSRLTTEPGNPFREGRCSFFP